MANVRNAADVTGENPVEADVVIVGAGLFGLVTAQQITEHTDKTVHIIDIRDHIGGNAYSYFDKETGAEIHKYGAHLFHTSNDRVWEYVNRFSKFTNYVHRVYTTHDGEVFPLPVNLGTINQFFHAAYTPEEAKRLIEQQAGEFAHIEEPQNLDEQGKKLIGEPLYNAFIRNYTGKQWQTDPSDLPASIIRRLPVRFNYDNRYFKDTYEGLPADGYTRWMENMIDSDRITVTLGVDFFDENQPYSKGKLVGTVPVIYTGPVDKYFNYELGELKWRTVDFKEVRYDEEDHFGVPVMNYADADVPYTRAIEFKNFNPERREQQNPRKTVVWEEYSRFAERGDEPYYPINTDADKELYAQYKERAAAEPQVVFGGRLGTYAYYDMHQVINTALIAYEKQVKPLLQ
ncbi:UDP-galactopyranose mutase [Alloscardovia venturai]|uniref:UDP-galactopyranose mutase n=1 Tax=Alloscardovia venturai TaxID=1769421 RepID=A0ABW2Y4L5_9BIFI